MKRLLVLGTMLLLSFAVFAQDTTTTQNTGVKQDMKTAGKATKNAAKKTGHKVKTTTKKGVHKGAHAVHKGSGKVQQKTQTPPPPPQE